ncbi:MAG: DUF3999 family protein [Maribacter sp.]
MKNNILIYFTLLTSSFFYGQMDDFTYKSELSPVKDQWHKIDLPNDVLSELNQNLFDMRIYGITATDTVEAPYLLQVQKKKHLKTKINFEYLNESHNNKDYFFTFKNLDGESINQIQLDFKQSNYDWGVILEGSQDQQTWFTILENYRILSIANNQVDYGFNTLTFPNSDFKFYRITINSAIEPNLDTAGILVDKTEEANYRNYSIVNFKTSEKNKQTTIDIDLKQRLPVSLIKLAIEDEFQYYRPILIEYISDSVQTEKGIRYSYNTLGNFTLTSLENNTFEFESTLAQKFRLTILNYDNQPLHIKGAEVKGYVHTLMARFTQPAAYYLAYSNKNTGRPNYDIANLEKPALISLTHIDLGKSSKIPKVRLKKTAPIFENKFWLWGIMLLIMGVLSYFTFIMLKKKS